MLRLSSARRSKNPTWATSTSAAKTQEKCLSAHTRPTRLDNFLQKTFTIWLSKNPCDVRSDSAQLDAQKPDMMCAQTFFLRRPKSKSLNLVLPLATSTRTYLNVIYQVWKAPKKVYQKFTLTFHRSLLCEPLGRKTKKAPRKGISTFSWYLRTWRTQAGFFIFK